MRHCVEPGAGSTWPTARRGDLKRAVTHRVTVGVGQSRGYGGLIELITFPLGAGPWLATLHRRFGAIRRNQPRDDSRTFIIRLRTSVRELAVMSHAYVLVESEKSQ